MVSVRALRRLFWITLPVLLLAACSGIGKGDKLETLAIVNARTGLALTPPVLGYQCLRQQLSVFGTFTSKSIGDYTARATWTSSNPAVVKVSNGDPILDKDPANSANVFQRGVITPMSIGTAVVTAEYVGIIASINVEVRAPDSIILSTSPIDATPALANTSIAPSSLLQFRAYARLDGVDTDVSSDPRWSIVNDPANAIATISSTGLVVGVGAGGPVTVNANFDACPGTAFNNLTANVTVSPVRKLSLTRQFSAGTQLVVGTTEALTAIGTLDNGATQDLSAIATYTTSTPASSVSVLSLLSNFATAASVGTTDVTASFGATPATVTSAPVTIATQTATLNAIAILAADQNRQIAPHGHYDHYHALGTYTPTAGGANFTQDITRHVLWTSSDATAVFMANTLANAGFALSLKPDTGCFSVIATLPSDTSNTASTKLGVGIAATPANCP